MERSSERSFRMGGLTTYAEVVDHYGDWATGGDDAEAIGKEWEVAGFSLSSTMAALDAGYFEPADAMTASFPQDMTTWHDKDRSVRV